VGVIDKDTETVLAELVEHYDADPKTTNRITTGDVLYCITDGIVKATSKEQWESSFWKFLKWCKQPADLVYAVDFETLGIKAGDVVKNSTISNYEFAAYKDELLQYEYKPNPSKNE
jgi:hypothetical protein